MKILVTGANGYLGQGIVKTLLDKGHQVVAVDFSVEHIDARAKRIKEDLFELESPYAYFEEPDVLLHLAWRDGFIHYSDAHMEDLSKHIVFLKKMIIGGIKQIAVLGTMHEIGFFEGAIKEDTPCWPSTPYGISKNALRAVTKMMCSESGVVFQWLRGFYIVGNSQFGASIFSKITEAEKAKKERFPFVMGQNQCDFIDYEEFAEQVASAVVQNKVTGIINICSGRPEKLADRVERFIKENGYNIKLEYGAFPDRPYDSKAVWGDDTKIRDILENSIW